MWKVVLPNFHKVSQITCRALQSHISNISYLLTFLTYMLFQYVRNILRIWVDVDWIGQKMVPDPTPKNQRRPEKWDPSLVKNRIRIRPNIIARDWDSYTARINKKYKVQMDSDVIYYHFGLRTTFPTGFSLLLRKYSYTTHT